MGRRLPEVGRPGQDVSILAGDDVDPTTGRLLTVAELQQALQAALAVHAQRLPRLPATAGDTASVLLTSGEEPAVAREQEVDDEVTLPPSRSRWMTRWAPSRSTAESLSAAVPATPQTTASVEPARLAPAGFVGAAADVGWAWLTSPEPPRVMVCSAPGVGVEGTRIAALLAGVMGAARQTLAVDIGRGMAASLTHLVCGTSAERMSAADWLPQDPMQSPDLTLLPVGPSGTHVVQTGTPLWDRVAPRIPGRIAMVTDLGLVAHDDVRKILVGHHGPAVMVARADSTGVTAALAALTDLDAEGLTRRPLLVLADAEGARPSALRAAQRLAQTAGDGVVVVAKSRELRSCPIPASGWRKDLAGSVTALVAGLAEHDQTPLSLPARRLQLRGAG